MNRQVTDLRFALEPRAVMLDQIIDLETALQFSIQLPLLAKLTEQLAMAAVAAGRDVEADGLFDISDWANGLFFALMKALPSEPR